MSEQTHQANDPKEPETNSLIEYMLDRQKKSDMQELTRASQTTISILIQSVNLASTVILAFFTVKLWVSTDRIRYFTGEQNALTAENSRIQLAPYISLEKKEFDGNDHLMLTFKNSGQTPALDVKGIARLAFTTNEIKDRALRYGIDESIENVEGLTMLSTNQNLIGPGLTYQTTAIAYELIPLGSRGLHFGFLNRDYKDDIDSFKKNKNGVMFVFGSLVYKDVYKDKFSSRFCFYFENGDFSIQIDCSKNNDIRFELVNIPGKERE